LAESDSPQLTHGWTTPFTRPATAGVAATSWFDWAQSASSPPCGAAGRPRNGSPLADPAVVGHCGAPSGAPALAAAACLIDPFSLLRD
jgi:hypothetical protein